jgi:hypothetical protein
MAPKNCLLFTPYDLILRDEGHYDIGADNHDSCLPNNIFWFVAD